MKLSELMKQSQNAFDKYGDLDVHIGINHEENACWYINKTSFFEFDPLPLSGRKPSYTRVILS